MEAFPSVLGVDLQREKPTGDKACAAEAAVAPDARSSEIDGQLDAEDLARLLIGFRGLPIRVTSTMRYVRGSNDGAATPYIFDEESGMVYILD